MKRHLASLEKSGWLSRKAEPGMAAGQYEQLSTVLEREVCFDWQTVVAMVAELCAQLAPVHRKGSIHGSLSSDYIIADFASGKICAVRLIHPIPRTSAQIYEPLTFFREHFSLLQNEPIVSPEQRNGEPATPASDIYAPGAVMCTAIAGNPPPAPSAVSQILGHSVQSGSLADYGVPSGVQKIISRCLSCHPRHRYKDADELYAALVSIGANGAAVMPRRRTRRAFSPLLLTGCAAGLLLLVGSLFTLQHSSEKTTPVQAARLLFNKEPNRYRYGDRVVVTIDRLPVESTCFLFYVDDKDQVVSLYPSRSQVEQPKSHLKSITIDRLGKSYMTVSPENGKLLLVCIKNCLSSADVTSDLVRESDWSTAEPRDHSLQLKGSQLFRRVEELKVRLPDKLITSIIDAPKCQDSGLVRTESAFMD